MTRDEPPLNTNDARILDALIQVWGCEANVSELRRTTGLSSGQVNYSVEKMDGHYIDYAGDDEEASTPGPDAPKKYSLNGTGRRAWERGSVQRLLPDTSDEREDEQRALTELESRVELVERMVQMVNLSDDDVKEKLTTVKNALSGEVSEQDREAAENALDEIEDELTKLKSFAVPRTYAMLHLMAETHGEDHVARTVNEWRDWWYGERRGMPYDFSFVQAE